MVQESLNMTDIKNKYHVALNGVGYMLKGAPDKPAYTRSVVPSQVNRLAISDLEYSDFAGTGLFYLAQTDWSAGIKNEQIWRDDGKYYYSTNLDTYSYNGEIKVEKELVLEKTFSTDAYCGTTASVNGVVNTYVGTYKDTNIRIYKRVIGGWTGIDNSGFSTSQNAPAYIVGHKEKIWIGTVGGGNLDCVDSFDGTGSLVDHQPAIDTATGWNAKASRSACEVGGTLFVGVEDSLNGQCALVSTDDSGATWDLVKDFGFESSIVAMCDFNSKLYYIFYSSGFTYLRVYDPATFVDTLAYSFGNVGTMPNISVSDKLLKVFLGKLIITVNTKIFEYDGNNMNEIWEQDTKKNTIGLEADSYVYYGCVEKDNKLFWGNLIYDGENFFNHKKLLGDDSSKCALPLCINSDGNIIYMSNIGYDESIYVDVYSGSAIYKKTTAKNFIIFSEMAPVVSIDKLLYSVTAIFEKMVSGDEINIEYSINNRVTWTTAKNLTYASEGTGVKREIIIPGSILFNKIWWRVSMANTNGTSSPVLLDLIMAYRPMPEYKNRWQMRLNFSDGVKLLNRQNDNREGYDMNSQLWNEKLIKRQIKFEDVDYIECTVNGALSKTTTSALITANRKLPLQGRIRAISGSVSEEMYYTTAKVDRIMGITRGARGTVARDYPSGQVLDNGYNVYVEDISTSLAFTDEEKTESIAQVLLIEA